MIDLAPRTEDPERIRRLRAAGDILDGLDAHGALAGNLRREQTRDKIKRALAELPAR